jgi:hypothetical protein
MFSAQWSTRTKTVCHRAIRLGRTAMQSTALIFCETQLYAVQMIRQCTPEDCIRMSLRNIPGLAWVHSRNVGIGAHWFRGRERAVPAIVLFIGLSKSLTRPRGINSVPTDRPPGSRQKKETEHKSSTLCRTYFRVIEIRLFCNTAFHT